MPTLKQCLDCGTLTTAPRCAICRSRKSKARDRMRPSTTDRGYGTDHQAARAEWAPIVASGHTRCTRCGELIQAGQAWDLDHDDLDRTKYRGPSHALCNRGAPHKGQ